ncbi:hypothetical protein FA13DRAFT_538520 [Coprinellus micaceus]|uniref:Uncharacterized protein n=1 Tax=Coprinellus micaceus TaxID=71717 RepID=A0A4Y7SAY6_COPMI|nr:hypothetical protein FA13DRAFT_538520 [Coprinellus micaceus]
MTTKVGRRGRGWEGGTRGWDGWGRDGGQGESPKVCARTKSSSDTVESPLPPHHPRPLPQIASIAPPPPSTRWGPLATRPHSLSTTTRSPHQHQRPLSLSTRALFSALKQPTTSRSPLSTHARYHPSLQHYHHHRGENPTESQPRERVCGRQRDGGEALTTGPLPDSLSPHPHHLALSFPIHPIHLDPPPLLDPPSPTRRVFSGTESVTQVCTAALLTKWYGKWGEGGIRALVKSR